MVTMNTEELSACDTSESPHGMVTMDTGELSACDTLESPRGMVTVDMGELSACNTSESPWGAGEVKETLCPPGEKIPFEFTMYSTCLSKEKPRAGSLIIVDMSAVDLCCARWYLSC